MLRREFIAGLALAATPCLGSATANDESAWPDRATTADLEAALQSMNARLQSYQAGDYSAQWRLTDARMRRWINRRIWRDRMRRARRRDGALLSYIVRAHLPVTSAELPKTEMGHRFREHVDYVISILETRYENAAPAQPEYFVGARSREGWRFAGGTILNRPLGETAVILTVQDEQRYEPNYSIVD